MAISPINLAEFTWKAYSFAPSRQPQDVSLDSYTRKNSPESC